MLIEMINHGLYVSGFDPGDKKPSVYSYEVVVIESWRLWS
jgi:hypothetical protein